MSNEANETGPGTEEVKAPPKRFTVLLAGKHIIAAQYVPAFTLDGAGSKILVWYAATEKPIEILDTDEVFEYYFNHWQNEKNNMLEAEETKPDPVGPVEGDTNV